VRLRRPDGAIVHNGQFMQPGNHGITRPPTRLEGISRARQALLSDLAPGTTDLVEPWIARSWQRCLALGHQPRQQVTFDAVSTAIMRRTRDGNQALTQAAHGVLRNLGRALADTRYFAILTNADGVVVDTSGPIDRSDRRADLIARVGVDLSERSVGTTAIGSALTDLQPVWLHRGEHFFDDNAVYSCAGAPLFGPDGQCVGMLDLTGVDVPERPELLHLAVQSARAIENALVRHSPHSVMLRLNWPGYPLGGDTDAIVGLDIDGRVTACNRAARDMVPSLHALTGPDGAAPHADDLFAMPFALLFDTARRDSKPIDVPLWSGLRLHALALPSNHIGDDVAVIAALQRAPTAGGAGQRRLRDIETDLIRKAVEDARGNVAQAAARLGVSRATVYRKLGLRKA
jgi:transcriptional regulator of acetoin/glycerol metabolism